MRGRATAYAMQRGRPVEPRGANAGTALAARMDPRFGAGAPVPATGGRPEAGGRGSAGAGRSRPSVFRPTGRRTAPAADRAGARPGSRRKTGGSPARPPGHRRSQTADAERPGRVVVAIQRAIRPAFPALRRASEASVSPYGWPSADGANPGATREEPDRAGRDRGLTAGRSAGACATARPTARRALPTSSAVSGRSSVRAPRSCPPAPRFAMANACRTSPFAVVASSETSRSTAASTADSICDTRTGEAVCSCSRERECRTRRRVAVVAR